MIEIILCIVLLGFLATVALPQFINITTQARQASRDGVAGAIRAGIILYRSNRVAYSLSSVFPDNLTGASVEACSTTNPCFGNVMIDPITDGNWAVTTANSVFTYDDGLTTVTYTYNSANGSFD